MYISVPPASQQLHYVLVDQEKLGQTGRVCKNTTELIYLEARNSGLHYVKLSNGKKREEREHKHGFEHQRRNVSA